MQGRRRRIPQHSRLRPRLQDTKPGPRAGEIGTKEKTRASLMPLASGSHASGSANEIACSAPRRTRSVLFFLVLPFAGGSATPRAPKTLTLNLGDWWNKIQGEESKRRLAAAGAMAAKREISSTLRNLKVRSPCPLPPSVLLSPWTGWHLTAFLCSCGGGAVYAARRGCAEGRGEGQGGGTGGGGDGAEWRLRLVSAGRQEVVWRLKAFFSFHSFLLLYLINMVPEIWNSEILWGVHFSILSMKIVYSEHVHFSFGISSHTIKMDCSWGVG